MKKTQSAEKRKGLNKRKETMKIITVNYQKRK